MADNSGVEIPKRALFRAAEVCEIVKVQPYVLRSWESEFPDLGVAKTPGAPRIYRRADVEQVVRIKHLLLVEGLTLAGARRRLEEEAAPVAVDTPLDELMGRHARERITEVKRGLQALLDLLSGGDGELRLAPTSSARPRAVPVARPKASRGAGSKIASPRNGHRRAR
jgi:DNA-binding transcriptional MerR regulator